MGEFLENLIAELLRRPGVGFVRFTNVVIDGETRVAVDAQSKDAKSGESRWREVRCQTPEPHSLIDAVQCLSTSVSWDGGKPPDQLAEADARVAESETPNYGEQNSMGVLRALGLGEEEFAGGADPSRGLGGILEEALQAAYTAGRANAGTRVATLERRLSVHECLDHEVPEPASCECCAAHDPDESWKNPTQ